MRGTFIIMITKYNCEDCSHRNLCTGIEKYQEEINRVSNENKSKSYITVVNCNNHSKCGRKHQKQAIYTSNFRYDCYFKNDIMIQQRKENAY